MPFLWLAIIGVGLYALGSSASGRRPSSPATTPTTPSDAARICAERPEAVSLEDSARLSAWAECPGRAIRDLRVLAARLERAATDETADQTRRARLIDAHVSLTDWIATRERDRTREGVA